MGLGSQTGKEGMERLWSFLRRFARVTKEITPSHRLDLLTDALLHYGRRKSTDLVLVSEGDMVKWKKREMELAQQKQKPISKQLKIEDSLLNIEKNHRIGRRWQESDSDFQSTLKDVDCELRGQLIFKARTELRERAVLLHLKRKYPDGQGIAIRLSKQIASSNKRLRQAIKEYNRIQWPPQMSIFPTIIDFQEACDPSCQVYFCFDDTIEEDNVSRSLNGLNRD
ncbi:uncharacterized protein LOC130090966 [Rhinichthys klamathensis goyatoka]|uniref:uncharacterized protein LOC130090966 n=1 Tax=Rhinichthys klamathensis goyatoka TaxID=3034132 RepID=UPI0024B61CD7|nr:uncharacterized protein LOC130090966 [Rhinichthys klamathensis goyatoka]